jgi:hypothetical protein
MKNLSAMIFFVFIIAAGGGTYIYRFAHPKNKINMKIAEWAQKNSWKLEATSDSKYMHIFTTYPFYHSDKILDSDISLIAMNSHVFALEGETHKARNAFLLNMPRVHGDKYAPFCHTIIGVWTGVNVPKVIIYRKGHGGGNGIGVKKHIVFESTKFMDQFIVESENDKEAYDVVTQEVIELILRKSPIRIIWEKGYILWIEEREITPAVLDSSLSDDLSFMDTLFDLLPGYIKDEYGVLSENVL